MTNAQRALDGAGRPAGEGAGRQLLAIMGRARDGALRVLRALKVGWDHVPITVVGAALAALALWAFLDFAPDTADHVVYSLSAVALALVALSVVAVGLAAFVLHLRLRGADSGVPEGLMTGSEHRTTFHCPSFRFWPLVQVKVDWVHPTTIDVATSLGWEGVTETVTPRERGHYDRVRRRFVVGDIFGFASMTFYRTWEQPLEIRPALGVADVTLEVRRATSDGYSHPSGQPIGEMVEMRRYAHGDPMRHVIWKAFARNRRLMVREPERAIAPRPAMVGYFIAGERDEPSASTARLFLEKGLLGADFVFMADGAPRPTSDRGDALNQIIRSQAHKASGGRALSALFRAVDRARLDNLVVFVPAADGPWVDALLRAAKALPMPPMVILTVDGRVEGKRRSRLRRFFWDEPTGADPSIADLPRLHQRLVSAGLDLRVIHRSTGRRLEAAQIAELGGKS